MDSQEIEPRPNAGQAPVDDVGSPDGRQEHLTRSRVAEALEVSVTTIRRMEGSVLHPRRGQDGVHRFDRSEVERLAAKRGSVIPNAYDQSVLGGGYISGRQLAPS